MGRYITPVPLASQTGPVKKRQIFKTSGTFVPSQKLLDAGGVVTVRCVGGGGAVARFINSCGASSGMDVTRMAAITGPVTVLIGAGGIAGPYGDGADGGATHFGSFLAALGGKKGGTASTDGASTGEGSQPGYKTDDPVFPGRGGGIGGGVRWPSYTTSPEVSNSSGVPNTGGGGAYAHSNNTNIRHGGSGICIVTWEE